MTNSDTSTSSQNYRQVGTNKKAGRLVLGSTQTQSLANLFSSSSDGSRSHSAPSSSSSLSSSSLSSAPSFFSGPSIPSKYETILYKDEASYDGFGTRTSRFSVLPAAASSSAAAALEVPGPGQYHQRASFEWKHDSLSKKGYGAMISKADRFGHQRRGAPGPGQYNHLAAVQSKNAQDFNRSSSSSVFKSASSAVILQENSHINKDFVPGPGSYNANHAVHIVHEASPTNRKQASSSSSDTFDASTASSSAPLLTSEHNWSMNKSPRFLRDAQAVRAAEELPGPGQYDPLPPSSHHHHHHRCYQADFISKDKRFQFIASETPGPGYYTTDEKDVPQYRYDAASHMFKAANIDRFGDVKEKKGSSNETPGPGQYNINTSTLSPSKKASFSPSRQRNNSNSHQKAHNYDCKTNEDDTPSLVQQLNTMSPGKKRVGGYYVVDASNRYAPEDTEIHSHLSAKKIRAPGPAYYNADPIAVQDKKSFHLNVAQKWL